MTKSMNTQIWHAWVDRKSVFYRLRDGKWMDDKGYFVTAPPPGAKRAKVSDRIDTNAAVMFFGRKAANAYYRNRLIKWNAIDRFDKEPEERAINRALGKLIGVFHKTLPDVKCLPLPAEAMIAMHDVYEFMGKMEMDDDDQDSFVCLMRTMVSKEVGAPLGYSQTLQVNNCGHVDYVSRTATINGVALCLNCAKARIAEMERRI